MQLVNNIAQNPYIAVELKLKKEYGVGETPADESSDPKPEICSEDSKLIAKKKAKGGVDTNEALQLQESILKIGKLLYLVFGQAGNTIVANNLNNKQQVELSNGEKIFGLFGFCDIRNFTDVTEVLEKDVMIFVNEIASIVHSEVDIFQGAANKNIGDAFL